VLQYADDTIIYLKHDIQGARNLKLLLYMYELMAGLKINFMKSEILTINDEENWAAVYAEIFNCQIGFFPIKYLGVPVSPSRLHISDWSPLIDKSSKKLDVWKGGNMSIAGRTTLIEGLNNSPVYHMSIYLLPKTTIECLDKIRRRFFWQGGGTKKKYHLVRWEKICKSKRKGGLGIKNLRKMNVSLLSKWWWKLENENGFWQEIVRYKYLRNNSIHDVCHKLNDSQMWYDLLIIKSIYLQGRNVSIKNGESVRFWWDNWLYDLPLKEVAPVLFELSENKGVYVSQVKNGEVVMQFRRWLYGDLALCWERIWSDVKNFSLSNESDVISWKFEKNGKFSVKSVYNGLTKNDSGLYHKRIWKGKIPPKIKIFLWLLTNDAILTKDNLLKRKWSGDPKCVFCEANETITHLFSSVPLLELSGLS